MVIFNSYVNVYQRVRVNSLKNTQFPLDLQALEVAASVAGACPLRPNSLIKTSFSRILGDATKQLEDAGRSGRKKCPSYTIHHEKYIKIS
jgi:hypothetical protein